MKKIGYILSIALFTIVVILLLPLSRVTGQQIYDYNIFNRHGAVMLMIDNETGKIEFANQAALDFYGFSKRGVRIYGNPRY